MIKPDCEVVCFYNIHCRLNILVYEIWSIGYLEAKVFYDGLHPLDNFGGKVEGVYPGVF